MSDALAAARAEVQAKIDRAKEERASKIEAKMDVSDDPDLPSVLDLELFRRIAWPQGNAPVTLPPPEGPSPLSTHCDDDQDDDEGCMCCGA